MVSTCAKHKFSWYKYWRKGRLKCLECGYTPGKILLDNTLYRAIVWCITLAPCVIIIYNQRYVYEMLSKVFPFGHSIRRFILRILEIILCSLIYKLQVYILFSIDCHIYANKQQRVNRIHLRRAGSDHGEKPERRERKFCHYRDPREYTGEVGATIHNQPA